MDWNLQKEMVPRKQKERVVSPWALLWQNENYYLIAFDEEAQAIRHFRVDKMGKVKVLSVSRDGAKQFDKIDLAAYSNQTFGMYGGKEEIVTLSFPESLLGVAVDRFGKDIGLRKEKNGRIRIRVKLTVSPQFFGWMAGLGRDAKIVSPDSVRKEYVDHLRSIVESDLDQNE